ncbi:MAG: 3D-(3,5/4)-trihydroxycyclohexane-1,2-dione acylhydrolase (decyclizing) [Chloroflexota bacterium]
MPTQRLTMAQALILFLKNQHIEHDNIENLFFAGMLGIFGHGNVAGIGQALQENPDFKYIMVRNEQAAVHIASGFAKMKNRLQAFACTSSIGPGATNMITGAALATISRLPVLLLPGDIFARRNVAPVLQQLESPNTQDISVNDCFKPVSRYWDRINRPDQLITVLPEVMRVLTSPADTGAVTLSLPQDVQTEAYDYPEALFKKRVWRFHRPLADRSRLREAITLIKSSNHPLIVAGGGVHYSSATHELDLFCVQTGIPVGETQAGKGSLAYNHSCCVGAIGATGTLAANILARDADLVIGVGTRYSDFTTASKTAFQNPDVKFININLFEMDAFKHNGIPLTADARVTLEEIRECLKDFKVSEEYTSQIRGLKDQWETETDRLYNLNHTPIPAQSEIIGALWDELEPKDVIISAAGSQPGDLHKLWRAKTPNSYHMEYGYSCMAYEIPAAIGVKFADPSREVYAWVGDGSYLMNPTEIVTAVQEGIKINIIVVDNHGFGSIGSLSGSLGSEGFGTRFQKRNPQTGKLDGSRLVIDYAANAASLGAVVFKANTIQEFKDALKKVRKLDHTSVIVVLADRDVHVPGYETWWDVAVAEISTLPGVQKARKEYEQKLKDEKYFL